MACRMPVVKTRKKRRRPGMPSERRTCLFGKNGCAPVPLSISSNIMKISFLRICAVWRRFRRGVLRHHADHAQYLPQIESLMRRADPQAGWSMRANWMLDLVDCLRHEPRVSLLAHDEWRRLKHQRLRFMLDWLDEHRDVRQNVQNTLRKTLREASGHELFSSTGMPRESAFFSELSDRLAKLVLPRPLGQHDL